MTGKVRIENYTGGLSKPEQNRMAFVCSFFQIITCALEIE